MKLRILIAICSVSLTPLVSYAFSSPAKVTKLVVKTENATGDTSVFIYGTKGSQAQKLFESLKDADQQESSGAQGQARNIERLGKDIDCTYEIQPSRQDITLVYSCEIKINSKGESILWK